MAEHHHALLEKFKKTEKDDIDKNMRYPDAPFWKMAAQYGQIEMEAHLKWADDDVARTAQAGREAERSEETCPPMKSLRQTFCKPRKNRNRSRRGAT